MSISSMAPFSIRRCCLLPCRCHMTSIMATMSKVGPFSLLLTWINPLNHRNNPHLPEHQNNFPRFPGGSAGKESTCNAGDLGLMPQLGQSPGEGKGYPLWSSGLENSMDCIVHRVAKSRTLLSDLFTFTFTQFQVVSLGDRLSELMGDLPRCTVLLNVNRSFTFKKCSLKSATQKVILSFKG